MFVGKRTRQLDGKGRLAIPAEFLARMAPEDRDEIFVAPGEDGCIWLLPKSFFMVMAGKIEEAAGEDIRDQFYHFSQARSVDKAGRVLLDEEARMFADLADPGGPGKVGVVVCGSGRYMQVWGKDDYYGRVKSPRDFARTLRASRRAAEKAAE